MPTYEYQCAECKIVFELFQPITEPPRKRLNKSDPKPCDCNAKVTRLIGIGGGVIFKGSGFYQTDYRSEGYKSAAKAEKEASNGKDDKKSDKTTAATKEAKSKPAKSQSTE
jgi:putative FmdB family regulatory protein